MLDQVVAAEAAGERELPGPVEHVGVAVGRPVVALAVLAEAHAAIDDLPGLLAAPRDPDLIFIPWQGWSLTAHDFLTTRMMEMVVHGDDLASSVDLPTPTYPDDVVGPVLGLLAGVAASAVVR